ncbi:hypothetical protein CRM22_000149 [Opisthorchis felineus]|uniref:Uncharacterized protein n=1 Tax=Opisthorchis felineus TaxID=147828 RepID=A0A4S2MMY1_OPIFE|nr:hypothetical protein CRM22_000149 [Opisthorchis felineus]
MDYWAWSFFVMVCAVHVTSGSLNIPDYKPITYQLKREQHRALLAKLLSHPHDKALRIVQEVCSTLNNVLHTAYGALQSVDLDEEPMKEHTAAALVSIIENVPLLLELSLHYPDVVHHVLHGKDSMDVLQWAVNITMHSGVIPAAEEQLFLRGRQELNLLPRPSDYVNPASAHQRLMREKAEAERLRRETRRDRRKVHRGPKLTTRRDEL